MMPKLPVPDGYADGGKTPEGYTWSDCYWIETSVRAIQEEAYKAGMAAAVESCAQEAEHWQRIGNPDHACGKYIAGAIRSVHSKEVK